MSLLKSVLNVLNPLPSIIKANKVEGQSFGNKLLNVVNPVQSLIKDNTGQTDLQLSDEYKQYKSGVVNITGAELNQAVSDKAKQENVLAQKDLSGLLMVVVGGVIGLFGKGVVRIVGFALAGIFAYSFISNKKNASDKVVLMDEAGTDQIKIFNDSADISMLNGYVANGVFTEHSLNSMAGSRLRDLFNLYDERVLNFLLGKTYGEIVGMATTAYTVDQDGRIVI